MCDGQTRLNPYCGLEFRDRIRFTPRDLHQSEPQIEMRGRIFRVDLRCRPEAFDRFGYTARIGLERCTQIVQSISVSGTELHGFFELRQSLGDIRDAQGRPIFRDGILNLARLTEQSVGEVNVRFGRFRKCSDVARPETGLIAPVEVASVSSNDICDADQGEGGPDSFRAPRSAVPGKRTNGPLPAPSMGHSDPPQLTRRSEKETVGLYFVTVNVTSAGVTRRPS